MCRIWVFILLLDNCFGKFLVFISFLIFSTFFFYYSLYTNDFYFFHILFCFSIPVILFSHLYLEVLQTDHTFFSQPMGSLKVLLPLCIKMCFKHFLSILIGFPLVILNSSYNLNIIILFHRIH